MSGTKNKDIYGDNILYYLFIFFFMALTLVLSIQGEWVSSLLSAIAMLISIGLYGLNHLTQAILELKEELTKGK